LSLVDEAQKYLQLLVDHPDYAKKLDVPDGSRKMVDSTENLQSLHRLKVEVDELATDMVRELSPLYAGSLNIIQRRLIETRIY